MMSANQPFSVSELGNSQLGVPICRGKLNPSASSFAVTVNRGAGTELKTFRFSSNSIIEENRFILEPIFSDTYPSYLHPPPGVYSDIVWMPDGKSLLMAASGNPIPQLSFPDLRPLAEFGNPCRRERIGLHPDLPLLFLNCSTWQTQKTRTGSAGRSIGWTEIRDIRSAELIDKFWEVSSGYSFHPDGTILMNLCHSTSDSLVRFVQLQPNLRGLDVCLTLPGLDDSPDHIKAAVFHPSGSLVAIKTIGFQDQIRLLSFAIPFEPFAQIRSQDLGLSIVPGSGPYTTDEPKFSQDGSFLITPFGKGHLMIFSLVTMEPYLFPVSDTKIVAFDFDPIRSLILTGDLAGEVRLFQLNQATKLGTPQLPSHLSAADFCQVADSIDAMSADYGQYQFV